MELLSLKAADWAIVFATLVGPILAVQAQKRLERIRERLNAKRSLYITLMATRTLRVSPDHIRALNALDLAFYGVRLWKWRWQSNTERAVTIAWATYLDNLSTDASRFSEQQAAILYDRRTKLFFDLLEAMWAAAGFMDTLLRWKMEPEVVYGNETAIQPGVQA